MNITSEFKVKMKKKHTFMFVSDENPTVKFPEQGRPLKKDIVTVQTRTGAQLIIMNNTLRDFYLFNFLYFKIPQYFIRNLII